MGQCQDYGVEKLKLCPTEKEFKNYLQHTLEDVVVSCIDFFENYVFMVQNEIQDMHWFSFQITILVHITYQWNKDFDPVELGFKILKESHYYIFYEKEHDILFVQHAFRLQWLFFKEGGCFPQHHVVWSNGCASQFKNA